MNKKLHEASKTNVQLFGVFGLDWTFYPARFDEYVMLCWSQKYFAAFPSLIQLRACRGIVRGNHGWNDVLPCQSSVSLICALKILCSPITVAVRQTSLTTRLIGRSPGLTLLPCPPQFVCTVIAILLHYFCMCTFAWMFVEGLHIYRMLTELRNINHGHIRFYYAMGWGIPAIITGENAWKGGRGERRRWEGLKNGTFTPKAKQTYMIQ